MLHRLKTTWVMKTAHKLAKERRHMFDTYQQALSSALRRAWRIAKGKLFNDEDNAHYADLQEFLKSCTRFVDVETMKNAS